MEQWEALLDSCPTLPDLRYFSKAVQIADVVLKEDLAPFETEWILQTLLYAPVNLISNITSKHGDDLWAKAIGDSFKLLAKLSGTHTEAVENHFQDIVTISLLPFAPSTRKLSLNCLAQIAKVSVLGAKDVNRHVNCLEDATTCRAPLAVLIGTICEHHPVTIADDFNRIWRIFLNLLDCNKNTDTITHSLLLGVLGLFKHFGCDLPTVELNGFYDRLATDYIRIHQCEDVCFKILADHWNLFREKLSKDVRIRNYLWNTLYDHNNAVSAVAATVGVYKALYGAMSKEELQRTLTAELLPHTQSPRTQVKYTALRILTHTKSARAHTTDTHIDVHSLQFELSCDSVSYDSAEAVSYCIQTNQPNSDQLLQTAILFYTNLPSSRRKEIVVHGLLNAAPELRTSATNFLTSQSTLNADSLERHLPLWKDMFDTASDTDDTVIERSKYVFEDFMAYLVYVLGVFLESDEKPQERIQTLLNLSVHILSLQPPEHSTKDLCLVALPLLIDIFNVHPDANVMAAVRCACVHLEDDLDVAEDFYKTIRIDRCKDEALLCESCLTLVHAPNGAVDSSNVLLALQIMFSRNDVEPTALIKALKKLEFVLVTEMEHLDENSVGNIIHQVEKLRCRKDLKGKDARVLHRDVIMFLGNYGNRPDVNNNKQEERLIITKLMDSLTLNVPNPNEGTSYKINLRSILQLCLEHEDPETLQMLLIIICANLQTRNTPELELCLTRVCYGLSRALARGHTVDVDTLTAGTSVHGVLGYISEEKSPGVRKMLSDALEELLVKKNDDELIAAVAERASIMMSDSASTTKRAGLNITEILMSVLKKNNHLTKTLLPPLLIIITKTNEIDSAVTFEIATRHFIEKIELFDNSIIEDLIKELIGILVKQNGEFGFKKSVDETSNMASMDFKTYKITTKMVLEFIENIFDYKKEEKSNILYTFLNIFEKQNGDFERSLHVLAEMKKIFDFNTDLCRHLLSYKECLILNKLLCMEIDKDDCFCIEILLRFLDEYQEILLEIQYQKTLDFVAKLISNLTPDCIKILHKTVKNCLSRYVKKSTPIKLRGALEKWCDHLALFDITENIENKNFTQEHSVVVFALKAMLQTFNSTDLSTLTHVKIAVKDWPRILLSLYSQDYIANYLKSKMAFLTDILAVSAKFLTVTDVKKLLLEGLPTEKIGVRFAAFFMNVFYDLLVVTPHLLLDNEMAPCCILINDIVKHTLKKKRTDEEYENVLELANELWPTYDNQSTFDQKHSLLQDLSMLPKQLGPASNPMRWAVGVIESEGRREDHSRIVAVLPGGAEYCATYRRFSVSLPTKLSELKGSAHASLKALLDALAHTRDGTILDIVCTLAAADETKGWWDDAIDSCMASIAAHADLALYKAVYTRSWEGLSLGVCRRVLLPLLRYSSSNVCEKFFASVLKDILALKKILASNHYAYHKSLVDYCRALILLQVAFEKIAPSSLESPSSHLYSVCAASQSWHIIRETCKKCVSLRDVKLPEGASDDLTKDYRTLCRVNYTCLCAALCRRRPPARFYDPVFDVSVWDTLVDDRQYDIRIRSQWNQRTIRQPVSIDVETRDASHGTFRSGTATGTVRTRMFLRTLSENPLMYDLIEDSGVEEVRTQDLQLTQSEFNSHECAATLTALVCHATTLTAVTWRERLGEGLRGGKRNTRWLLAQTVCNCKEELKPHASALHPALLEVVASTAVEHNNKNVLNGLHVDIIETLIHWGDAEPLTSEPLNGTLALLLTTCLEHTKHISVYRKLLEVLTKFIDLYANVVAVSWGIFEDYLNDLEALKTIKIISKIYIPELLPTLLSKLEGRQCYQLPKLAELVGLALNACNDRQTYLFRFRKILDQLSKNDGGEYVKMLYYAQSSCRDVCNEYHFKKIMNLAPKLVGPDKSKCLQILANYTTQSKTDCIAEMFETIDLADLITIDNVNGLNLVKEGVGAMGEGVKRRLVGVAAGFCTHSVVKVRKSACGVALAAFEDLLTEPMQPPSAKKPRTANTQIMKHVQSSDIYVTTVLNAISLGVIDRDASIADLVRQGIASFLNKNDMGARFTECFLLCVYLPIISNDKTRDLSVCVPALLDVLFSHLRTQEMFKQVKLRNEPLESRQTNTGCSKLLTMSKAYQGTFRGYSNLTNRRKLNTSQEKSPNSPAIDVQIPIERILDTFLRFSKENSEIAQELCIQFAKALPGFEPASVLTEALSTILAKQPNELTPFVVELSRVFVGHVCLVDGILETAKLLTQSTSNTEGDRTAKLFYNEIKLRQFGEKQFVLGLHVNPSEDDEMPVIDEERKFSLQDLTSAFGQLANWDSLTIQQQNAAVLPPLWTDHENFARELTCLDRGDHLCRGWFDKMVAAFNREDKESTMKWLRALDKWPRRHFEASAITEAIEWLSGQTDKLHRVCDIQPADCLAEWAARLMIRSAYIESVSDSESKRADLMLSRSHESIWCERAIERGIWEPVLDCVKRNTPYLYENDTLPFLYHKVLVQRNIELKKMDSDDGEQRKEALQRLLNTIEKYTPRFADNSKDTDVIAMNKLMLMINGDMKQFEPEKLQISMEILDDHLKERIYGVQNKNALVSFYETAVSCLDINWDDFEESNLELVWSISVDILKRLNDINQPHLGIASTIINKLQVKDDHLDHSLDEDTARLLLDVIKRNYLDDFVIEQLDASRKRFPSHLLNEYDFTSERDDGMRSKYKKCLQLICDAEYSLLQYCVSLSKALRDDDKESYIDVFNKMKNKMFENPYAGSDYQILNRYRNKLYGHEIKNGDFSKTFKTNSEISVKEVILELRRKVPQSVLRLSQLCPELTRTPECPGNLLGLPECVSVVRFDEQIPVFTDSIRRPTIIKVLLSNGKTRRYLHKSGESMASDAAAQSVSRCAAQLWAKARCPVVVYNVTRLSSDSGLIEYLEDHERLRDLIAENCDLDAPLSSVRRPADHELLSAPIQASLSQFEQLCGLLPSRALRDAILKRSITQSDFIVKTMMFQDTVASSTILTWILNLGDRHLQNVLYSTRVGGVCHVDWGAAGGGAEGEYAPARLTRNVLAVCHVPELEAKLQQLLSLLRSSNQMFVQIIDLYFKRLETQYDKGIVENILQGKINFHPLPPELISKLTASERNKLNELLHDSEWNVRRTSVATVDDQVTSLLHRCTDPRLLSVTRSGWEPWV